MIKAIETSYKGYRFRSRLEARWAVAFDAMGIKWEYENQSFWVAPFVGYMPDFWLPKTKTWVEVKGDLETVDWNNLAHAVMSNGLPEIKNTWSTDGGLLVLGSIPDSHEKWIPIYPLLQHSTELRAGFVSEAVFSDGGFRFFRYGVPPAVIHSYDGSKQLWIEATKKLAVGELGYYVDEYFVEEFKDCKAQIGFSAARRARFEHGESG